MSDKSKKFQPSVGFIVSVHQVALGIRAVAEKLDVFPEVLAKACEDAGFQLVADPFDLASDAGRLIVLQNEKQTEGLRIVKEPNESDSNASTD